MASPLHRPAVLALLAAACAMLSSCFLSPGKFASTLNIRSDGQFTFSYAGDIHFVGLSELMKGAEASQEPVETPCYDDDGEERPCTAEELEEQRRRQEALAGRGIGKDAEEQAMAAHMLGGIDPNDPEALVELARKLERQAGWRKVEYVGEGRFVVDFEITSHLSHDFLFPTMEETLPGAPFVAVHRRNEGQVRINARGFVAQGAGNPLLAMMMSDSGEDDLNLPEISGTFRIITDARILANNTDEGPVKGPLTGSTGQVLEWNITPRTAAVPTALLQLAHQPAMPPR